MASGGAGPFTEQVGQIGKRLDMTSECQAGGFYKNYFSIGKG
jgi:hypothetical protein